MPTTHVKIETFIKLFVNHRPVYGIGKNNIEKAFEDLISSLGENQNEPNAITKRELRLLLQQEGEQVGEQEFERCMQLLIGEKNFDGITDNEYITADDFAENVLGFEEVDENELDQEDDEEELANAAGMSYASGNPSQYLPNEVIPEEQN